MVSPSRIRYRNRRATIMTCDRKNTPEFTKFQILECEKCKHASGKKIWCCLFGVYFKQQLPSKQKMAKSFLKAGTKHVKSGLKKRSNIEQKKIMDICIECGEYMLKNNTPRCKKCGCYIGIKQSWATAHCPVNKW